MPKNLFQPDSFSEIMDRVNTITPHSQRQWGKMNAAQMLAHCNAAFEVGLGERTLRRGIVGFLFGKLAKKKFIDQGVVSKNSPTDPTFKISDERDFQIEKARLLKMIERFHQNGPQGVPAANHSFFGPLSPEEWARLMYNHLDHHLRQFNA